MSMPEPETVNTRHTLTGIVQRVTPEQYELFSDYLEIVADDAKSLASGDFTPGKVGEHDAPEPPTDAVAAAQASYDAVIADGNAPNSKIAREAKAAVQAAEAEAQAQIDAAEKVVADAETQEGTASSSSAEGDAQ
ncbi:MAG: hypothetical protein K0S70_119 [Microbacterium sp.]|jgi:hypothetical protein|nr:hypothetical protein [Microbacterium sp.]